MSACPKSFPLALSLCLLPLLAAAQPKPASKAQLERGRYLVTIGSCNDCHTPWKLDPDVGLPLPDMSRMLSGHPEGAPDPASAYAGNDMAIIGPTFTSFRFPFGVTYAANLTPDPKTGLGTWTEEMFVGALRKGKHMGGSGRTIMPPMPWPLIGQMSDADLKAVFAYLRTIPAVHNEVPPHQVPDAVIEEITMKNDRLLKKLQAAQRPANSPAKASSSATGRR